MKKAFVTPILAAAFLSVSCGSSSNPSNAASLVNANTFAGISKNESSLKSMLAVDLASSLPLLDFGTAGTKAIRKAADSSAASSAAGTSAPTDSSVPSDPVVTEDPIISVLESLDLFMAGDVDFSMKDVTSTNAAYTYQMDISFALLDGSRSSYSLNYNSSKSETEISEDETETKVTIEGVSLIEETEYTFTLESKTETSKDEQESEVEFLLKLDDQNFVAVKNSLELEENEKELKYSYRKVAAGVEEVAYKLSFENEDDDQEDETKLVQGGKVYTIETEVKDGKTLVHVIAKTEATGEKTSYLYERTVSEVNGEVVTTYTPVVA
jgi:hypothetical protein